MAEEKASQQVLICGGGNGAHVFAGLAASNASNRVHWLSLYADEAQRIEKSLASGVPLKVTFQMEKDRVIECRPQVVTNDPSKAIPGSDLIIVCVPAFAHGQYLDAIAQHAKKGTTIAVVPGYGGLLLQYYSIFTKHGLSKGDYTLLNFDSLPWACRINEYGKEVCVLSTKDVIGCIQSGSENKASIPSVQGVFGELPKITSDQSQHMLSYTLDNSVVHPALMYAKWKDWTAPESHPPLEEKPLFYQGLTQEGADLMEKLSQETIAVAEALNKAMPDDSPRRIKVTFITDWFRNTYGSQCKDDSTLFSIVTTNPGYNGLCHPMRKADEEKELWYPDFRHRYMREDIPYALMPTKGLALIVGLETPVTDMILRWAEKVMGQKYLSDDGQLNGDGVQRGRAPQTYGMNTLAELMKAF